MQRILQLYTPKLLFRSSSIQLLQVNSSDVFGHVENLKIEDKSVCGFELMLLLLHAGTGLNCYDVDECLTSNGGCSANAMCHNTVGSRTCACKTGFTGNGTHCTDINECTSGTASCSTNAGCTNTEGSYACSCNAGFEGTILVAFSCDQSPYYADFRIFYDMILFSKNASRHVL